MNQAGHTQVVINELMASNTTTIEDPDFDETADWFELYNSGDKAINLRGYYLTDNLNDPEKWKINDDIKIEANAYKIFWADGRDVEDHTSFKLSADGEELGLFSPDLTLLDDIIFTPQASDVSFGRNPLDPDEWVFFDEPTPNGENNSSSLLGFVENFPEFSILGGLFSQPVTVELWTDLGGDIKFTLDGSEPDENATSYTSPIEIESTTIVRARIFKDEELPGPVVTHSYFVNEGSVDNRLPMISIASDPENFWDPERGIYVQNFKPDWEVPINIELFENIGEDRAAFNEQAGAKINGLNSWQLPQKMLGITFRKRYGSNELDYRLFYDRDRTSFEGFALRASGNDWSSTLFRDILGQDAAAAGMPIATVGFRPCIVYINGEYMGIHNIRSKVNEDYVVGNYGMEPGSFDMIENEDLAEAGSLNEYKHLESLLGKNLLANDDYENVAELMDIANFTDFVIAEIFDANTSIGHNVMAWKPKETSKWQWILMDLDRGFNNPEDNLIDFFIGEESIPLKELLINEDYRKFFVQRLVDHLYTTFDSQEINKLIDKHRQAIEAEIPRHIDRWMGTTSSYGNAIPSIAHWNGQVNQLRGFPEKRREALMADLKNYGFEKTALLGLGVLPRNGGSISMNKIQIDNSFIIGNYLMDFEIDLNANAKPGYEFRGWVTTSTKQVISKSSEWNFYDKESAAPSNWKELNFDASDWTTGMAQLGYGDGDEITLLNFGPNQGNKFITSYFRKEFELTEAEIKNGNFMLNLLRDDGAIVYVNGTEVVRSNLTYNKVAHQTTATRVIQSADESKFYSYDFDNKLLIEGKNVVAVEIHQADPTSTDVSFDLELLQHIPGKSLTESKNIQVQLEDDLYVMALFEENTQCRIDDLISENTTLTNGCSTYIASGDVTISEAVNLTIEPGVEILMSESSNFIVHGSLTAIGTEESPIIFKSNPLNEGSSWGSIMFLNTTGPSKLKHIVIENASIGEIPIRDKGAISAFKSQLDMDHLTIEDVEANPIFAQYSDITLTNSTLHSKITGDLINVKYGTSTIRNCTFYGNDQPDTDGIDYDEILDGEISNCSFYDFLGFNSDAIDIGENAQNVKIDSIIAFNISDKGVSIGQRSSASIENSWFVNCSQGISVKDSSNAVINHCTFYNNAQSVVSFEKNPGRAGGNVTVKNSILSNSPIQTYFSDEKSQLTISNSLSDTDVLPDESINLFGDPGFTDPTFYNFKLLENALARSVGTQDGSATDIGAALLPFDRQPSVMIVQINYNPSGSVLPEYIAIHNPGLSDQDLSGYKITRGVTHTIPEGTILPGGDILFISESASPIWWRNPTKVQAWSSGKISNSGETIQLEDSYGLIKDHVKFSNNAPWPVDGDLLTLKHVALDNHLPENWATLSGSRLTSGIAEQEIFAFPNPTKGAITIWVSENFRDKPGGLYTLPGQFIEDISVGESGEIELDMAQYPTGVLILNVGGKVIKLINESR